MGSERACLTPSPAPLAPTKSGRGECPGKRRGEKEKNEQERKQNEH